MKFQRDGYINYDLYLCMFALNEEYFSLIKTALPFLKFRGGSTAYGIKFNGDFLPEVILTLKQITRK